MANEEFTPQQSIALIQSMIDKTRENISDNTIYYLVWGWITFFACTGQFILKRIVGYDRHYLVWWIIVVGIVFSIWRGSREEKTQKLRTYVGDSIKYLWIGMGIAYFVLSMIISTYGWDKVVFPFFIMLYGLGTFVSGNIIRFRPLVVGGVIAFALAVASAWMEYDYQILAAAVAILSSYIVPAYMLRKRIKMQNVKLAV